MLLVLISWITAIIATSIFAFSAELVDEKKKALFSWVGVLITIYLALSIPNPIPYFLEPIAVLQGYIRWQELMLLVIIFYALVAYAKIHKGLKPFIVNAKDNTRYFRFIRIRIPDELKRSYTLLLTAMLGPILLQVPFLVKAEIFLSIGGVLYGAFFVFSGTMTWVAAISLLHDGLSSGKYNEANGCLFKAYVYSFVCLMTMAPLGLLLAEKWFTVELLMLGIGILMLLVATLLLTPRKFSMSQIIFLLVGTIVISIISSIKSEVFPHPAIETGICIISWIALFYILLTKA